MCWSLRVAWPILCFRDLPHVRLGEYLGAFSIMTLARFFVGMVDVFDDDPDTDHGDSNGPDQPVPWPQTPKILDLEYKSVQFLTCLD